MPTDVKAMVPTNKKRIFRLAKLLRRRSIKCLNKHYVNSAKVRASKTKPTTAWLAEYDKNYVESGGSLNSQESLNTDSSQKDEKSNHDEFLSNHKESNSVETKTDLNSFTNEIEANYNVHDKILTSFADSALDLKHDNVQLLINRIISEIHVLDNLLKVKELEWNKLLHVKSAKQELLTRIQRKNRIKYNSSGKTNDNSDNGNAEMNIEYQSNSSEYLSGQNYNNADSDKEVNCSGKRSNKNRKEFNGFSSANECRQGRQGPIIDVRSIIADYRQNHPDVVPRRGRRLKSGTRNNNSDAQMSKRQKEEMSINQSVDTLSLKATSNINSDPIYKDVLSQLKELSQNDGSIASSINKMQLPHPEVSMHPVQSQSLLHATLKKAQNKLDSKPTFSPTLAKLLTAPKRSSVSITNQSSNDIDVSIADLLSTRKDETADHEDSVDRLVIDEENSSQEQDSVFPGNDSAIKCQGCNQKSAKFVCAGCGNQWYCSRECQISAWDDHSDVCSG